jgi:hypothetical protein
MRNVRDLVAEGKRVCSKCRLPKPIGAFAPSRIHMSGHDPRCSDCYVGYVPRGVSQAEAS